MSNEQLVRELKEAKAEAERLGKVLWSIAHRHGIDANDMRHLAQEALK